MSYEELAAEGYLSDTAPEVDGIPHWKDGCLFTITEQNGQDSIHVEQDSKNITGADPLPPYRREKRRCLPTASGGGRTRAVRLLSGKNGERRTGRFAEQRDL